MFRLAEDMIRIDKKKYPELYTLATEVVTERLLVYVRTFFDSNGEVDKEKLIRCLDIEVVKAVEEHSKDYLVAKAKQLLKDLEDREDVKTPDVFNEYLLVGMLRSFKFSIIKEDEKTENLKPLIKKFVPEYYKEYMEEMIDGSDGKKRAGFIRKKCNYIYKLLTDVLFSLEDEESEYGGFLLWDWDYSLFTDYGFEKTIKILCSPAYGCQVSDE